MSKLCCIFELLLFELLAIMARVKRFDQASIKSRLGSRKHRYFKKMKAIHEKYIYEQLHSKIDSCINELDDDSKQDTTSAYDKTMDVIEQ